MKKIIHLPRLTVAMTGLLGLLLVTGCKTTTGYQQAEKTTDQMGELRSDLVKIQQAIDNTVLSMESVTTQAKSDPRKSFAKFSRAVRELESADQTAKQRAEQMRTQGKAFFEKWEQDNATVQNPEVKRLSQKRRAELDATFRDISRVTVQVKDELNPWISDVRDLHTFLSNDLTPTGIQAAQPLLHQAKAGSDIVKGTLDRLIRELDSVSAAIAPAVKPGKEARAGT